MVSSVSTDDFFDVSPDVMALMEKDCSRKSSVFGGTSRSNSRAHVESNTTRWRLSRFCDVCRAFNIDPLCPVSLHLVWILTSKCHNKRQFVQRFATLVHHTDAAECLDWDSVDPVVSMEMHDWLAMLQYTSITSDDNEDAAVPGVVLKRLTDCWSKSRVVQEYGNSPPLLQHVLLYIMLEDVAAEKILEQKLGMLSRLQEKPACRDLEIRCLRCIASFNNEVFQDEDVMFDCMPVLTRLVVHTDLFRDIISVLKLQQTQSEAHEREVQKHVGRMQLRQLAKQLHASKQWVYSVTFDAWATQQQFAVTTTRRQQLMLYFIKAQQVPVVPEKLRHLFSVNLLRRLNSQSIDQIDARAILCVIQSIRVYTHNVTTLVDFRMQCLSGITQTYKKSMSMAQILQLYVACHQHESIVEACWRGIVPMWNFTIQSACAKFVQTNTYQIDAVVDCLLKCMLESESCLEQPTTDGAVVSEHPLAL